MSEIEKMYMHCKIKKQQNCSHSDTCYNGSLDECEGCNAYKYPPFTAEKQIELIKWLGTKQYAKYTTSLLINIKDTVRFSGGLIAGVCTLNVKYDKQDKDFENALAGLVNEMWQDLTAEEKASIKNILCQNCTDCVMKQIVENLRQVAYAGHCDSCDGCGYYNGCGDTECGTYQALKSLELLDIQEVE